MRSLFSYTEIVLPNLHDWSSTHYHFKKNAENAVCPNTDGNHRINLCARITASAPQPPL